MRGDNELVSEHGEFKGEVRYQEEFQENLSNQPLLMLLWNFGKIFGLKVTY